MHRSSLLRTVVPSRLFLASVLGLGGGCFPPQPPTINAKEATVTGVTRDGVAFDVQLSATNPNGTEVRTSSVSAKVMLDGTQELGDVTVSELLVLPAHTPTTLKVPLLVPWSDITALFDLATANRDVPYQLDGTVVLGAPLANKTIPFRVSGVVSHSQLASGMEQFYRPLLNR